MRDISLTIASLNDTEVQEDSDELPDTSFNRFANNLRTRVTGTNWFSNIIVVHIFFVGAAVGASIRSVPCSRGV